MSGDYRSLSYCIMVLIMNNDAGAEGQTSRINSFQRCGCRHFGKRSGITIALRFYFSPSLPPGRDRYRAHQNFLCNRPSTFANSANKIDMHSFMHPFTGLEGRRGSSVFGQWGAFLCWGVSHLHHSAQQTQAGRSVDAVKGASFSVVNASNPLLYPIHCYTLDILFSSISNGFIVNL